jgi:alpha-glucosidase
MTVDPWWKSAVFYELDPLTFQDSNGDGYGDLNGIVDRLDYLHALGVDAIVLSPFQLPPATGANQAGTALDAAYGTDEDFDRLEREASLRKMRVLVDLPLSAKRPVEETLAVARFWLSRGVAGLRLTAEQDDPGMASLNAAEREQRVRALRKLCAGYVGERVLVWDVPGSEPEAASSPGPRRKSVAPARPQLQVDRTLEELTRWDATGLQAFLQAAVPGANSLAATEAADRVRSWGRWQAATDAERLGLAKTLAAALFLGRQMPWLYFGQEIGMASAGTAPAPMQWGGDPGFSAATPWVAMGPNAATANVAAEDADPQSLLNWYRKLGSLVHENGSLHGGSVTPVETGYPDVVAWVRRGKLASDRPVLAVCNLSGHAVLISLTEALSGIGVRATSRMEPLATSFAADPSIAASGISLPPYGVYVGEAVQPGLEDAPAPVPHRRRGR